MKKPSKGKLDLTDEQKSQVNQTIGCCRWVYNHFLALRDGAYYGDGISLTYGYMSWQLTQWKHEEDTSWLMDADSMALQQSLRDLDCAFSNFFDNVAKGRVVSKKKTKAGNIRNPYGHPRFKRKCDSNQSYRTQNQAGKDNIKIIDRHHIKLPKLGVVKVRGLRDLEGRITSATVWKLPTGDYEITVLFDDVEHEPMPQGNIDVLGIDVGIEHAAVDSEGVVYENPRALKACVKKLAREQRKLSRKAKGSANYAKQKRKVARIHAKMSRVRNDAKHKMTTDCVRKSQAIAAETLNVKGMLGNHCIAKAASDAAMSETIRQLKYKCEWNGRGFVQVDRWFPSSKLCHACGAKNEGLTLSDRVRTCPHCGERHERDYNAALNIRDEGVRILNGTAGHAGTAAAKAGKPVESV